MIVGPTSVKPARGARICAYSDARRDRSVIMRSLTRTETVSPLRSHGRSGTARQLLSRASRVGAALWLFWSPPAQALELTPFLGARWLPLDTFHAGLDIGSGAGWLGERAARTQRLGEAGPTLHLGLTADFFDLVSTSLTFGTIFVDEKAAFSEMVIDEDSDVFEADSSLNINILGISAGLRTPDLYLAGHLEKNAWIATSAFARYGHAWLSGSRGIGNCIDCAEEELTLDDGDYLDAGVDLSFKDGNAWGMRLYGSYRHYLRAAPVSEIQIGIGFGYW